MKGVEIDFVVSDSIQALELYEKIFEVERIEVTNFKRGLNEAVFSIYGARFHILDENSDYGLVAPQAGEGKPMWVNIAVDDIKETYDKALSAGCYEVAPITEIEGMGVTNAIFADKYGYFWSLHQINEDVSFEEREKLLQEQFGE